MSAARGRWVWLGGTLLLLGAPLGRGGLAGMSCQVAHPSLLFDDIAETPGYQLHAQDPWMTWEQSLVAGADAQLGRDFSQPWADYNRVFYRAGFARNLALAYQITKDPTYGDKAAEALLHMDVGEADGKTDWALALGSYCLAYDWVQPHLDVATDATVRDALAALADSVYKDLNDNGTNLDYVTFSDYHGQAYPMVGVAGVTLADYTNTAALSSTPADWVLVGTDYLFVNDALHSHQRSLLSYEFDEVSGKHMLGAYKEYVTTDFILWFQVHNHALGTNLFDVYPTAERAFSSELWESLPSYYHNDYVTSGNVKYAYHAGLLNLYGAEAQPWVLEHLDKVKAATVLPYSSADYLDTDVSYCTIGDSSAAPRQEPPWTSHVQQGAAYDVFRGSWAEDSEWLSLITFNATTYSNRDTAHHDQLSFEYYAKGDLLLADAGENKHVLDTYYGEYEVHHNVVAVEDPRMPFAPAPWSNGPSRGFFKGWAAGLTTPVTFANLVQVPWMELLDVKATGTDVIGASFGESVALSSPIAIERVVAFPDKSYFAVIDRLEGAESWTFRNVFRPTSQSIVPSADQNADSTIDESEVGHVQGELSFGGAAHDWLSQPYKQEISTGVSGSSLEWQTTSPYGRGVQLQLYSVPSSEILVTKHVGRIAGYDAESEVFSPVVFFRTAPTTSLYRITVLLARYQEETGRAVESLAVVGDGNALHVTSAVDQDFWYAGSGTSSFGEVSTDAQMLHLRLAPAQSACTWLQGSTVAVSGAPLAATTSAVDHLSWHRDATGIGCRIKTAAPVELRIYGLGQQSEPVVTMDDSPFTDFVLDAGGTTLVLSVPTGEHLFAITGPGTEQPDAGSTGSESASDEQSGGGCGCRAALQPHTGGLLAMIFATGMVGVRRARARVRGRRAGG
jgi:hypothetical protein